MTSKWSYDASETQPCVFEYDGRSQSSAVPPLNVLQVVKVICDVAVVVVCFHLLESAEYRLSERCFAEFKASGAVMADLAGGGGTAQCRWPVE